MNNSVVIVSVGAGYAYGPQGYTHHSLEDIAVMRALPNLEVLVPADPAETKWLTKFLVKSESPSYLRLGKSNEQSINKSNPTIKHGKFNEILKGKDGTILFIGSIGRIALNAAASLNTEGISVSVASVPFLSSPDVEYLEIAAVNGPIVTVEEHSERGGFGSSVLEVLSREKIQASVGIVAANQNNISLIGSQDFLRDQNGINESMVIAKFKALQGD